MLSTAALAFGMSMDAFAACLGRGAAGSGIRFGQILRTGLIFGSIETAAPLIGWAMGLAASTYVAAIDHWVAFVLLGLIGAKMLWEGATRDRPADPAAISRARRATLGVTALAAVGTSIDASAVGVTLALVGADILTTALAIGAATFVMSGLGMALGRLAATRLESSRLEGTRLAGAAEVFGGLVLIAVGTWILASHLGAA